MRLSLVFLLGLLVVSSVGCKHQQYVAQLREAHPVRKYFPPEIVRLYFGMPLSEFIGVREDISLLKEEDSWRDILFEEFQGEKAKHAVYYFDTDGDSPLYEIILEYPTEKLRDKVAETYFGAPNYADATEWRYDSEENYPIWVWKYEKKLVIAALLPGTEWADER